MYLKTKELYTPELIQLYAISNIQIYSSEHTIKIGNRNSSRIKGDSIYVKTTKGKK